ncbi:MAG: hypothetical protein J7513_14055 [Solirubrobacteraceae bacterium]|nr:hypothetical protein [Solirubrobacteraceae bacterium]
MSAREPWPSISDEALLTIWRAPDSELFGLIPGFMQRLVERLGPEILQPPREMAYTYPFGHPDRPTWVDGDEQRHPEPDEAAALREGRIPVLAIGANGSPTRLATKFLALDERSALLTPGELDGADICALPFPAGYGSFPAGIATSPGTRVHSVVVDLTHEQLEWLAVTEFGYRLSRLTGTTLRAADGREIDAPFAFVQRGGLYDVGEGQPAPLAAIPATGRRWPAWEQRDLFAHIAGRLGVPGADPDALLTTITADPGNWMANNAPRLIGEATLAHEPPHEPYPVGAA